jgi:hypothetical protein
MRRCITLVRERLALRDESGIALIMALGILFVLTISLGTVIYVTSASARHAEHSNAGQKAHALAEAGVNNAMAVLNANYPNTSHPYPGDRCLLHPQVAPAGFPGIAVWPADPDDHTKCGSPAPISAAPDAGRPQETVTWWGRLRRVEDMGPTWVIRSTGSVPNPTGPGAAPVTRTIQVKVPVKIADPELPEPGVLEWLYSPTSATALNSVEIRSPFYTRGNLLLGNGVEVYAPLYVTCVKPPVPVPTTTTPCPSTAGNVRMENTGQVFQGATVSMGGALTQTSPQNTVGTNAKRISAAHIVNGCETSTRAYNVSCLWDQHDVFVTGGSGDRIMPPDPVPNPPVIDWPFWYQFGAPGPLWGCDSGTTPMFESPGNTVLDNSVPTVFNLTPSTSYSCKNLVGELSWDAPSKTLTVVGTVYFDGSVKVEKSWGGQDAALYQGKGAIYMSGSFELKNTALCADRDDTRAGDDSMCDLSGWDPKVAPPLAIVAKSKGTDPGVQAASGNNSVEVKSSEFQGVLSGEHDILSETTSIVQGPVISFQGGLQISQTSGASFPDITFPPAGAPGNPPPPSILLEPREFEGG